MTSKRTISAANETATLSQVVKAVLFARLDFFSGVIRVHTDIGPRTATHPVFGAEVYDGIGDFGGISSDVVESVNPAPVQLRLSLTGIKSSLIATALTDDYFRRDAEIMLGLDDSAGVLVDDPEILFSGYMDKIDMTLGDGSGTMTLNLESRATNLLRSSDQRYTDEDKQAESPGDRAANYIYRMLDLQLRWGDAFFNSPFRSGGRGRRGRRTRTPSDRRLKMNVRLVHEKDGINFYEWEWNDLAIENGYGDQPTMGVLADELNGSRFVERNEKGFLTVDYESLCEHFGWIE